jgi:hypothetical protein
VRADGKIRLSAVREHSKPSHGSRTKKPFHRFLFPIHPLIVILSFHVYFLPLAPSPPAIPVAKAIFHRILLAHPSDAAPKAGGVDSDSVKLGAALVFIRACEDALEVRLAHDEMTLFRSLHPDLNLIEIAEEMQEVCENADENELLDLWTDLAKKYRADLEKNAPKP